MGSPRRSLAGPPRRGRVSWIARSTRSRSPTGAGAPRGWVYRGLAEVCGRGRIAGALEETAPRPGEGPDPAEGPAPGRPAIVGPRADRALQSGRGALQWGAEDPGGEDRRGGSTLRND